MATRTFEIDGDSLTLEDLRDVAQGRAEVVVAGRVFGRMLETRAVVERLLARDAVVYGVTTGFGKFAEVRIPGTDVQALQRNLIRSHCCGVGDPLSAEETRATMVLRANVLAKGHSGARPVVLTTLVDLLARGILPVIPSKGSVGASGDLAPLAHLAAVLIGEGEAVYGGRRMPAAQALEQAGIEPVVLEAKEGLALINGTQVSTALAALALLGAENLAKTADIAGAQSVEALRGTRTPYLPRTHELRPHPGQLATARNLVRLLDGSEILAAHEDCAKTQDAYSLRCMPQVHGAVKEALRFVRRVLATEVNSATDNPLVFPEDEMVVSGGNFHGQPVSQAMDLLGIAMVELAGMSERRVEYMVDPDTSDHLPAFLTPRGGLNSGLMIAQVTAAALVSESKTLAHPASVDSIPTSANKEDFVSMSAFAARKARDIVRNARDVIAIELLCGAQALEFRQGMQPGTGVAVAHDLIRGRVPPLEDDRLLTPDIAVLAGLLESGELVAAVEERVGPLELVSAG